MVRAQEGWNIIQVPEGDEGNGAFMGGTWFADSAKESGSYLILVYLHQLSASPGFQAL